MGSNGLGSSSFSLQCSALQDLWNTTLISGGWYDVDGNPIIDTLNGGPVSVDLQRNDYDRGGSMTSLVYIYRSQLNFDRPLRISDAGYYYCNLSVAVTYPDNTMANLSNSTYYRLSFEGNTNFKKVPHINMSREISRSNYSFSLRPLALTN